MCACRLEASSTVATPEASPVHDLEEYYPYLTEMDRASEGSSSDREDIYAQLAQKERDLILAAELGKALLEKNQELSKRNECLTEEYSQKLEVGRNFNFEHLRLDKFVLKPTRGRDVARLP